MSDGEVTGKDEYCNVIELGHGAHWAVIKTKSSPGNIICHCFLYMQQQCSIYFLAYQWQGDCTGFYFRNIPICLVVSSGEMQLFIYSS